MIAYGFNSFVTSTIAPIATGWSDSCRAAFPRREKALSSRGKKFEARSCSRYRSTINKVSWQDFAERAIHEMAEKSKALVKLYYAKPHKYAYWDGFSTGGRQGFKSAQKFPGDFDGILAGAPAFNWTNFITSELYTDLRLSAAGNVQRNRIHDEIHKLRVSMSPGNMR